MESSIQPQLIETGAKTFMNSILQKCHSTRVNIYIYALNISVFVIFVGSVCIILYCCYTNKLSPNKNHQKIREDQEYILSKIRFYKDYKRNMDSKASITGLPTTDSRPL